MREPKETKYNPFLSIGWRSSVLLVVHCESDNGFQELLLSPRCRPLLPGDVISASSPENSSEAILSCNQIKVHFFRLLLAARNPVYLLFGSGNWLLNLITMQLGNGFRSIFALVRP